MRSLQEQVEEAERRHAAVDEQVRSKIHQAGEYRKCITNKWELTMILQRLFFRWIPIEIF